MTFLLISNLNLLLSCRTCKTSVLLLFISSLQALEGCSEVFPEPSLLRAADLQLPQAFSIAEMLLWPCSHSLTFSCAGGPRPACNTPDGASHRQSRGGQSPPCPTAIPLLIQPRNQESLSARSVPPSVSWWHMWLGAAHSQTVIPVLEAQSSGQGMGTASLVLSLKQCTEACLEPATASKH